MSNSLYSLPAYTLAYLPGVKERLIHIAHHGQDEAEGKSGAAKNYVTRNQAIKKLQVTLADFRRLCILKGIFPRQPKSIRKANKGSTAPTTFFFAKDIAYLQHEPVLQSLRDHKTFAKKLSRAIGRREWAAAKNLDENKPTYRLDHIIKERYLPSATRSRTSTMLSRCSPSLPTCQLPTKSLLT